MVFVFGVDVPLVELILAFTLITFIMLIEVTVVMIILFYQLRRTREVTNRLEQLAGMHRIENKVEKMDKNKIEENITKKGKK
ncbi:MAG TPA: hypothetical protein VJH88_02215 [Candidatus Nanoarchaeia archaeon]|nr:hypothetical protein [Candidatus Nanoarchaeia archaeon]